MKADIVIRADANGRIGGGHLMRCLTIAKALRAQGASCLFAAASDTPESARGLVRGAQFELEILDAAHDDPEVWSKALIPVIRESSAGMVLLDSYAVTPETMRRIREAACLAYLDDLNAFPYPADLVINYNVYAESLRYPENVGENGDTQYLFGTRYVPLRAAFQGLPRRVWEAVSPARILFSAGAADPDHVTGTLIECAAEAARAAGCEAEFCVLAGAYNVNREELRKAAQEDPRIRLYTDLTAEEMRDLILSCDLAVSAAGTTLHEIAACGTPAITYVLADNQMRNAQAFAAQGLMENAGDAREGSFAGRLTDILTEYLSRIRERDSTFFQGIMEKLQVAEDGEGAARIAHELITRQKEAQEP